jgi:poly(3-hydroxybutyrate) depolymerase
LAFFTAAVIVVPGSACGSDDIVLGFRGAGGTAAGTEGMPMDGGAGTAAAAGFSGAGMGAQGGTVAGSSAQFAGAGGVSGMQGDAGMAEADSGGGMMADAASGEPGRVTRMSVGCGLAPPSMDTSIQIGGMRGSYLVDLPVPYDKSRPYPLIMALRGAGVTAAQFRGYLDLPPVVGSDAIVVHLNCLNEATTWDVARDLPLFDQLLTKLESSYCVDELRVFAAGHASGGFFTSVLGCMRADKLRGIAAMSAGPPPSMCSGDVAVWISQGNGDSMLGAGRGNRDYWAGRNGCNVAVSMPVDPQPCIEYAGCGSGFPVRYCEYDGDLGLPAFAATGLWEFFKGL